MLNRTAAFVVTLVLAAVCLAAQTRNLNLRGDRFKPLTWEQLTTEQRVMVDDLLSGTRTTLNGPFNVLLRSPEMGNIAQNLGEHLRFRSTVPVHLNEMAILMTARWWSSGYVWETHKAVALKAGLDPAIIDDLQAERRPRRMGAGETVIYDFVSELRETRRVSDATFAAAITLVGEKGVVDLVALLGYYDLVSMIINVDRYPLENGVQAPF